MLLVRSFRAAAAESVQDVFDIYTIIFLALAVFIFLRLRSVLGQRTGRERPPYDPFTAREPVRPASEKVVALPNRNSPETVVQAPVAPADPIDRWKGIAAAGSPVATGLDAIVASNAQYLIYKPMILLQSKKLYGCPADVFRTREDAEKWVKDQLAKN